MPSVVRYFFYDVWRQSAIAAHANYLVQIPARSHQKDGEVHNTKRNMELGSMTL